MAEQYSTGNVPLRTDPTRVIEVKILRALNSGAGGGLSGSGSPEGVVSAPPGATYVDTSGGTLYIKVTGTGATGWQVVVAGAGSTFAGSGSPEGAQIAAAGSTYTQTDTGSFWVKKTGSGNTGWIEIVA